MLKTKPPLFAVLGVFALCLFVPANAVALEAVWGSGEQELKEGEHLSVTYADSGSSTLKWTLAGIKIEISCTKATGVGWVENPTGAEMGTDHALVDYTKCTVPKPAGGNCKVHNELVGLTASSLLLIESEKIKDKFTAESGAKLSEVILEGCSNSGLNGTYSVEGTAEAEVNETTSILEFTSTSGSSLTLGGNAVTLTSELGVEMEGGGKVEVVIGALRVLTPANRKLKYPAKETKEIELEYLGILKSGNLAVAVTNTSEAGAFSEEAGGTCTGKTLSNTNKCKIKIKLSGTPGALGEVVIRGSNVRFPPKINLE